LTILHRITEYCPIDIQMKLESSRVCHDFLSLP
jgi:hypothetical protein